MTAAMHHLIELPPNLWHLPDALSKWRKLNPQHRVMFTLLAHGKQVLVEDLTHGLFGAMECTPTNSGQSMARRANAAKVRELWDYVHSQQVNTKMLYEGVPRKRAASVPDLSDQTAVEAWLDC